jgi:hypothetical protein
MPTKSASVKLLVLKNWFQEREYMDPFLSDMVHQCDSSCLGALQMMCQSTISDLASDWHFYCIEKYIFFIQIWIY